MTEKRDKVKFRDCFLLILALAAQRPQVQAGQAAAAVCTFLEVLEAGLERREHISQQVTFIHVY